MSEASESNSEARDVAAAMPQAAAAIPGDSAPPVAVIVKERRWSWLWVVPLLALLFVVGTAVHTWSNRGVRISIIFDRGHGLKPGDALRYRGIVIGRVRSVTSAPDLTSVHVQVDLSQEASRVASEGSRFWVVRPQLELTGASGMETLVGAKYLGVMPGNGARRLQFVGLERPPVQEEIELGGLEIVLQARKRGSLRPGGAVQYRQMRIGTVLSLDFASDASAVEARVYIRPPFTDLVRERSVFWDAGGLELEAGLTTGLSLQLDSLESLLLGGVALATPPNPGAKATTGQRFPLHAKPQEEWHTWSPSIPMGSQLLPRGTPIPQPLRVTLAWTSQGRWFSSKRQRHGRVLPIAGGLIGPADLLEAPTDAAESSAHLITSGEELALGDPCAGSYQGVALRRCDLDMPVWRGRRRAASAVPEDTLVIADSATQPRFLAAARYQAREGSWQLEKAVSFDPDWHGACVLSLKDGKLVGFLLLDGSVPRVALISEEMSELAGDPTSP